ncbi:DTW domain-containing protein 2 [Carex littledalei]|uniref:tRNA-uridine aminocarboxypropyltransferase n=1 Tax=Carex littledalei TaxID=544730 RepID=A0A833QJL5_9POAL|nr:DTW domain-containing protein 2 [Carex littledalei]
MAEKEGAESISSNFRLEEENKNEDSEPLQEEIASQSLSATATRRRATCDNGCGRPKSVCICPFLPPSPLPTATTVFILQHPHELRYNRLATVPFLPRCLSQFQLLSGRRIRPGMSPLLDSLHSSPSSSSPVLLLFLSPNAVDLSEWAQRTPLEARANPVLVLVDGTWNQAREMVTGSLKFLSGFTTCVSLGCEVGIEGEKPCETDLVLKTEPHKGCMSTIEAVARALRILESDDVGPLVEEMLLKVLRAMVGFQAPFMKPMNPRPRMNKKKGKKLGGDSVSV